MAGHPTDVGRAPEDVGVLEVEYELRRGGATNEIAAGGVHDALRLPRRARRVEDVKHILSVHVLGLAAWRRFGHEPMPPVVTAFAHGRERLVADRAWPALHDNDVIDGRSLFEGFVGIALERYDLAAAVAAVRG